MLAMFALSHAGCVRGRKAVQGHESGQNALRVWQTHLHAHGQVRFEWMRIPYPVLQKV